MEQREKMINALIGIGCDDFTVSILMEYYDYIIEERKRNSIKADAQNSVLANFIKTYAERYRGNISLGDDCFQQDFIEFRNKEQHFLIFLKKYYLFLMTNHREYFEKINERVVMMAHIVELMNEKLPILTIQDAVPAADKFILVYSNATKLVNLEGLNVEAKNGIKRFIWFSPQPAIKGKISSLGYYYDFLSDYTGGQIDFIFINNYKRKISQSKLNASSVFTIMKYIKQLCNYLNGEKIIRFDSYAFKAFEMKGGKPPGNTETYTNEEVELIIRSINQVVTEASSEDLRQQYLLLLDIIEYLLNTPMRLTTVLNLKVNDIHEVSNNTWSYVTQSKTGIQTFPISPFIYKRHVSIIERTESIRNGSDYLFIYRRSRGKAIMKVSTSDFHNLFDTVVRKENVRNLGAAGFRNRFMSKVTKEMIRSGTEKSIEGVTLHSLNVHMNYYYEENIESVASMLYGVEIGQTELKGIILPKNKNATRRNSVMFGTGNCNISVCEDDSKLTCYLCRHFVATPANIPQFEYEINKLDEKIRNTNEQHIKEHLTVRKALLVKYLVECYRVREESLHEIN